MFQLPLVKKRSIIIRWEKLSFRTKDKRKKKKGSPVEIDGAVVQSDDSGQLIHDELIAPGAAADKSEADVVAILVRGH